MVVQEESEAPEETRIQKHTMGSKKYIVFKNHVREISELPPEVSNTENTEKETRSSKNKQRQQKPPPLHSNQAIKDLEELKTVYKKCKSVMAKIERKYGHLIDLNDQNEHTNFKRRKLHSDDHCYHDCTCISNKKILFTENGEQISQIGTKRGNHICSYNNENKCQKSNKSIEIDYETGNPILPETIPELTEILKNPATGVNLRNNVIAKVKYLRYENLNTIRFNKESLVEQLKSNPEELMDFKGTNIASMEGYPTK